MGKTEEGEDRPPPVLICFRPVLKQNVAVRGNISVLYIFLLSNQHASFIIGIDSFQLYQLNLIVVFYRGPNVVISTIKSDR